MKVMLLSLPANGGNSQNMFPLGIGYLAGALKETHAVDAYHYETMASAKKEVLGRIRLFQPKVIGLTCSTFNREAVREMTGIVKKINADIRVVVGGVHASFCYEQTLQKCGADVVVIGEGENTLRELCDAWENNLPLESVKGIAYVRNGQVVRTAARAVVENLDDLPMPDFEYARPYIERLKMGFIITSRGCPVRCTFCSTSSYWGQKVRMNSVSRVVDEMEMLISRFRVRKIFFHDDTFNLGIPRVKAICQEIMDRKIKIDWACSCRVAPVSEEMLALMVEAGCRHICWGVETGSEDMLKKINKKITLAQIKNAFELSKKFSSVMSTGAFTMVGNPGETAKTIQDTVDFLNTISFTDRLSTSTLYVLPGTVLYEDMKKAGHIKDEDWFKYDTVPTYTLENSWSTLTKWAKMVNRSGNRIPFNGQEHFWAISDNKEESFLLGIVARFALLGPKRVFSMMKRYLPSGRIRF